MTCALSVPRMPDTAPIPTLKLDNGEPITEEAVRALLKLHTVPEAFRDGIVNYLVHHLAPGAYLTAVLSNDLFGAQGFCDDAGWAALRAMVRFFHNEVPSRCVGSPERVRAWIRARG